VILGVDVRRLESGMRRVMRLGIFVLALLSASFSVQAQVSTLGREFYLGFMENNATVFFPVTASVLITAAEKTTGYLEYNDQKQFFSLEKGQQFVQNFPDALHNILHKSSGLVEEKSIYIKSSGEVSVHAFNKRQASSDGTVVLPITALGKDHYITSHFDVFEPGLDISPSNKNFESTLLVVAVEDKTEVEITPTARVDFNGTPVPAVAPLRITLNKGQTFQLKAAAGDLTGTRVRVINGTDGDCKNLAVFGGNKMTSAGDNCATSGDHLYQQAYPIASWGKSYIHLPLADRTSGEIIKVLASQDNTQVKINGQNKGTLNRGAFFTFEFTKDDIVSIESSKPTAVSMIAKSGNCNDQNDSYSRYGDPSLVTLSPVNQMVKEMVFSSVKMNWIRTHLVNILVKKGTAQQTFLNGQAVGNQFKPVPTNPNFEYARLIVEEGANTLKNASGFLAIAYGSGAVESYAYAVGAALEAIQFETATIYPFAITGDKVACLGVAGDWKITTDNPAYRFFTWTFGDGSAPKQGVSAPHTFQKPGKYQISVLASSGEGNCDSEETFRFEVEVLEVQGKLSGPATVCPGIDEATYRFEHVGVLGKMVWEVQGGTILSEETEQIRIRWGVGVASGKIKATPYTQAGCPGKALEFTVAITEALVPDAPKGSSGICGLATPMTYEVPFPLSGRNYTWTATGGQLLGGQNTIRVEVLWDVAAPNRQLVYEEVSLVNGACLGISKVLNVLVYPALAVDPPQVSSPGCLGQANGSIQLQPRGGSGAYTYRWAHNPSLTSSLANGLAAGSYRVWVTDATGCSVAEIEALLTDPDPIALQGMVEVKQVSCFEGIDGEVRVQLAGGTPPFKVLGADSRWENPYLTVLGLAVGKYRLSIQDSRGCVLTVDVEMKGPEELSVTATVLRPGCEGSLDGQLSLDIVGGTAPYSVAWDNGRSGFTLSELAPGKYNYFVTDAKGCVTVGTATVKQAQPQLRMPTGFLPSEGSFGPVVNCPVTFEILIWDRWGDLVYLGKDPWDGNIKTSTAPIGSYSYMIRYQYLLEGTLTQEERRGIFMLLR
jgi:PKD repeat protein